MGASSRIRDMNSSSMTEPYSTPDSGFDELFLQDHPLIDVRAPIEFQSGHFPKSVNLPILEDHERHQVGICYREQGQEAAIQLGHRLVSGDIKKSRLEKWLRFIETHPEAKLYCYRGGLRSSTATHWIQETGTQITRIPGGYKALRNHLLNRLPELVKSQTYLIIGGKTGSGKTHFLNHHARQSINLEALANHRGSSFGFLGPQPSQITFENSLIIALMKAGNTGRVLLEDESVMIGSLIIPEQLFTAMKHSPIYLLEVPIETRAETLVNDYVMDRLRSRGESIESVHRFFISNLARIEKKLGGLVHSQISSMVSKSFHSSDALLPETHRDWVKALLFHYYDPLYERSIERSKSRIVARADENELASLLKLV